MKMSGSHRYFTKKKGQDAVQISMEVLDGRAGANRGVMLKSYLKN